ncbi:hypothetical protein [Chryseobacterium sp. YIM B08800]|uniref:hypothetical protein n=1 Tax=Chryseobacterium sp. YIM B08800 TaxID=2984136 RepID=UPI00223FFE4C|nr:hypothetical protein [Chryseobacterium sp. YIM B08800]
MNITVAKSWQELNEWQLQEIVDLYLNQFDKTPEKAFGKMIIILFQKNKGFWSRIKLWKIIRQVPISTLSEFGDFLLQPPKLHSFPEIENLRKPADRLGDLSIKQFSFMDQFFHSWMETKSDKFLRALCASIYRIGENFDEQNLPSIAKETDKISKKERQVIGFTYLSSYHHLADQFPVVFPKPKEKTSEEIKENRKPKAKHQPFSEIILNLVMNEETQPLGNLHESNSTRIYEFMHVFTKIIIKNKKIEQENAKRK